MSEGTSIQWATNTWSPWLGCRRVSPGCANCYITSTPPYRMIGLKHGSDRVERSDSYWQKPVEWERKSKKSGKTVSVFPSLMDWLDYEVPIELLVRFLKLIDETPHLTWLLLTKRPELWLTRILSVSDYCEDISGDMDTFAFVEDWASDDPPKNVWFGFSAEDQKTFNERWAIARDIPTTQLFVSFEPLLNRIILPPDFFLHEPWGIIGGESGPDARACDVDWLRSLVVQFKEHQCPVFCKQLGSNSIWTNPMATSEYDESWGILELKDKKGGDISEFPDYLQVREFPQPKTH